MNKFKLENAIRESMDALIGKADSYETKNFKQFKESGEYKTQFKFIESKIEQILSTHGAFNDGKKAIDSIITLIECNHKLLLNEHKACEYYNNALFKALDKDVIELITNLKELKEWTYKKSAIQERMELLESIKEEINQSSTVQELPNIDSLIDKHDFDEITNQALRNCWTSQKRQLEMREVNINA